MIREILRFIKKAIYEADFKKQLKELHPNTVVLSKDEKKTIKTVWGGYCKVDFRWFDYFKNGNGTFSAYYVPENVYYGRICRKFNRIDCTPLFKDKNYLDVLFTDIVTPTIIARNINGTLLNNNYENISINDLYEICIQRTEIVIKPSIDSSEGRNISFVNTSDLSLNSFNRLLDNYKNDYTIQECIKQHPFLNEINPSSVNHIRILSLLWNSEVIILSKYLTAGKPGIRVDNAHANNYIISINDNGMLEMQVDCNSWEKRNYSKKASVPNYFKMIDYVKRKHPFFSHFGIIGWDFTVNDNDEIVLIEANIDFPGGRNTQMLYGPLFGEGKLFKEIMEYTFKK